MQVRFLYKRHYTTLTMEEKTNIITEVKFAGKGCYYMKKEEAADDPIIASFYAVLAKEGTVVPAEEQYVAPSYQGKNYSHTIVVGKKGLKHEMHKGYSWFTPDYLWAFAPDNDSINILTKTIRHFLETHTQDITFNNKEDEKAFQAIFNLLIPRAKDETVKVAALLIAKSPQLRDMIPTILAQESSSTISKKGLRLADRIGNRLHVTPSFFARLFESTNSKKSDSDSKKLNDHASKESSRCVIS